MKIAIVARSRTAFAAWVLICGAAPNVYAGDAYWHGALNPGNASWNQGISGAWSNWYSEAPPPSPNGTALPVPTGVAIFGDNPLTSSVHVTERTRIATMRFLPDADQHGFSISGLGKTLTVHGRGILNQSAVTPHIVIADEAVLQFNNAARIVSGGGKSAQLTVLGGRLFFEDDSNGGDASVFNTNNGARKGSIIFSHRSSSGRMTINNVGKAQTWFRDRSTGSEAHFINNTDFNQEGGGFLDFADTIGPSGDRRISAGKIANNAGTLLIGHNELTVREDFTQRADGELVFWVSGSRAGSMRVRGKTRIDGALIVHATNPKVGRHVLVCAPGGRTGRFSNVTFTGFHNDRKARVVESGTDIVLFVEHE